MAKVSVIIPARNELFLSQTVNDILSKARGDIEVIAVLDGYWPDPALREDGRLIQIHRGTAMGMRAAINAAAEIARGEYLLKCDAHCMFAEGFDEVLQADCDGDWIVIPRRYRLDAENWRIREDNSAPVDYHFLSCPMTNKDGFSMHGQIWPERGRVRQGPAYDIDETMSFQGSCWFMTARHFREFLGRMSEHGYGIFSQEPQEIGNKTWLGGGKVMVNKRTWYAHLHKGRKYGRMYHITKGEILPGHEYSARYWMNNCWPERKYDIEWLVERFAPVPTWPENWRKLEYPGAPD